MKKNVQKEIAAYLKENLSKKRYTHSMNVAAAAKELAQLFGEDEQRAYFAGMIHDIAKELGKDEQYELAKRNEYDVSEIELNTSALLHAIAGAQLLKERFGIEDKEILLAVRYHTVAAGGMSRLAQIVYLADLISIDRDYKDVKKMRKHAHTSLEKGMYEALRFSVSDLTEKGSLIPISTIEAYNEYAAVIKAQAKEKKENTNE
ncbi:MAG: bis(5'-nucleosyl)-tetraphosphatase (symmetrical) YqeK [Ruminococcus sp.]|nr:bis(5'-nucleosyl)-tetraphosphatase (symmetrical) YqeK [Ruminococcus sp.]